MHHAAQQAPSRAIAPHNIVVARVNLSMLHHTGGCAIKQRPQPSSGVSPHMRRKFVAQRRQRVCLAVSLKSKYVKKFAFPKFPKADVSAALTGGKVMARQPNRKAYLIPKHYRQKKLVTNALSIVHKTGIDPTIRNLDHMVLMCTHA